MSVDGPKNTKRDGLLKRFEAKFTRVGECWLWQACRTPNGYGLFSFGDMGVMGAHRASWILYNGPIPDGMQVLHNCPGGDNTSCVNPKHLFLGSHQDNMDDKSAKGREARGEWHGLAKLTDSAVLEMRAGYANDISPAVLGRVYGIDKATVHSAVTGRTWGHVHGSLDGDDLEELLAVLREHEAIFREEVREKCQAGNAMTMKKLKERAAAKALQTHKVCKGKLCLDPNSGNGVLHPIDNFYVKDNKTGRLMARCKKCHMAACEDSRNKKKSAE